MMSRPLREIFADLIVKFNDRQLRRGDRAVKKTTGDLRALNRVAGSVTGTLRGFVGVIAGAVGLGAMSRLATSTMESTNELIRWSTRLNMSIVDLHGWTSAAATFGVATEDVADALKEMQLKAQDALTGGTSQAEMFERIGISLDDLRPRVNDASQLMEFFVGKLEEVNDEGLRNFTVDELMSDAGTRMLPVFRQGAKALNEMRRDAEAHGMSLQELAGVQTKFNRASVQAKRDLQLLGITIAIKVLPIIMSLARKGSLIVKWLSNVVKHSHIFEAALIGLSVAAGVFAVATIGVWGPVVLVIGAIVLLILAIDDLYTAFKGGKSVTEDWLNALGALFDSPAFGTDFIQSVRETWTEFFEALDHGVESGTALGAVMNNLWEEGSGAQRFAAVIMGAILGVYVAFTSTYEAITSTIASARKSWIRLLQLYVDLREGATAAFNAATNAVSHFSAALTNTLQPAITVIQTGLNAVISTAQRFLQMISPITQAAQSISGGARTAASQAAGSAGNAALNTVTGLPGISHAISGFNFLTGRSGATSGPSPFAVGRRGQSGGTTVSAPMSVDVRINEATDAQAVQAAVDRSIRDAQDRQARQLQTALVED